MRAENTPLFALPALLAMVMLAGTTPARASEMVVMALCNGGTAGIPGQAPPRRDCDSACHAGCQRRKART